MIKLSRVSKKYDLGGETFVALDKVSLSINSGDFTAILGPSGSGKSTLMHIIGLLDQPTEGVVEVNDRNIAKLSDNELSALRSKFVGFVFQQFNLINKLTVLENILLPTIYLREKLDYDPKRRALELIERFGLTGKAKSFPNKISGGQQQRVAIARALIMQPQLVLADEPTGNLDTKNGNTILDLLSDLNSQDGVTVILITHESDVAGRARKKILIKDGKLVK